MARVVVLIQDLLFGSRLQADLLAGGYEVELVATREELEGRLANTDVLVVDLTDERLEGAGLVEGIVAAHTADPYAVAQPDPTAIRSAPCTLGFYSHVDAIARERAQQAGFDLVVPRSRMAREGAQLVAGLTAG